MRLNREQLVDVIEGQRGWMGNGSQVVIMRSAAERIADAIIRAEGEATPDATVHVGKAHPDTSHAVEPVLRKTSTRRKVLAVVGYESAGLSGGATDYEIEQRLKRSHQTVSAARRALVLGGYLVDSGKRRKTASGHDAIVWTATGKKA